MTDNGSLFIYFTQFIELPSRVCLYLYINKFCYQVKSEFFDALSSAEKQARDNQSKLEALNNDYLKAGES